MPVWDLERHHRVFLNPGLFLVLGATRASLLIFQYKNGGVLYFPVRMGKF